MVMDKSVHPLMGWSDWYHAHFSRDKTGRVVIKMGIGREMT